jgi:hypothetical protein
MVDEMQPFRAPEEPEERASLGASSFIVVPRGHGVIMEEREPDTPLPAPMIAVANPTPSTAEPSVEVPEAIVEESEAATSPTPALNEDAAARTIQHAWRSRSSSPSKDVAPILPSSSEDAAPVLTAAPSLSEDDAARSIQRAWRVRRATMDDTPSSVPEERIAEESSAPIAEENGVAVDNGSSGAPP